MCFGQFEINKDGNSTLMIPYFKYLCMYTWSVVSDREYFCCWGFFQLEIS